MTTENAAGVTERIPAAGGDEGKGQATTTEANATTQAPIDESKEVMVPLSVVKALQTEVKETKEQTKTLADQNNLYKTQLGMLQQGGIQPSKPNQTVQVPENPLTGMDDGDIPTVGDVKKVISTLGSGNQEEVSRLSGVIAKLEVSVQDPQYETTIREFLPEIINSNPGLYQTIQASPNPLQVALTFAKTNPRYLAAQQLAKGDGDKGEAAKPDIMEQINQIIENVTKPGSPAQAAAGGSVGSASRFTGMTDDEFAAHEAKVLSGQI